MSKHCDDDGKGGCSVPPRPPHSVIILPAAVGRIMNYMLPDVPLDEQVFVSDPQDERWLHVVHRDDAEAMRDWLRWYHEPPSIEPRPSESRCGS